MTILMIAIEFDDCLIYREVLENDEPTRTMDGQD